MHVDLKVTYFIKSIYEAIFQTAAQKNSKIFHKSVSWPSYYTVLNDQVILKNCGMSTPEYHFCIAEMRILHLWFFLRTFRGVRFFFKGVKWFFPNLIFCTFWCQKWIQRRILSDHGAFFRHSGHFKQKMLPITGFASPPPPTAPAGQVKQNVFMKRLFFGASKIGFQFQPT